MERLTNQHKLGCYLAPQHDPALWKRYLFDIDPPIIRILLPGDAPADLVSQVHQTCPTARISLRWWDLDDGGEDNKRTKLSDPVNAAVKDALVIHQRIGQMEADARTHGFPFPVRTQLLANTMNEPMVWEMGLRSAISANAATMVTELMRYGLPTIAIEMSVGNPAEWPPTWDWANDVKGAIQHSPGSALGLHEYWQPEGPLYEWTDEKGNEREDWGALAGRYLHCDWQVPIIISECGVDGRIYNRYQPPDTGYAKFMAPDRYAGQTGSYMQLVKRDSRIVAILPFLTDHQDDEWRSFDTLPCREWFKKVLDAMDKDDAQSPPPTVHLPVVGTGGGSDGSDGGVAVGMVDPFVARAILAVESGGDGFADGRLKIRFEAHIFERCVAKNLFDAHFRYDAKDILHAYYRRSIQEPWQAIHDNQNTEYAAFEIAEDMASDCAYRSISMGAAQIMGFNANRVGFLSAKAMYDAFAADPNYHLIAFFNFLYSSPRLIDAMRTKDFRTVAKLYNGPGLVDLYSARLEAAYKKLGGR